MCGWEAGGVQPARANGRNSTIEEKGNLLHGDTTCHMYMRLYTPTYYSTILPTRQSIRRTAAYYPMYSLHPQQPRDSVRRPL